MAQIPQVWKLQPPRTQVEPHDAGGQQDHRRGAEQPDNRFEQAQPGLNDHDSSRPDHEGQELQDQCRVRFECVCPLGACLCPRRTANRNP
uniref:Uncharacterized protein n=1 Tax=Rat stool-associated circular ssDNA virus TaxID=1699316 RepID=A0A0S2LUG5_9VIRU|nr:hypothetical protein [Rat stool-associated circular ssDNA virus]